MSLIVLCMMILTVMYSNANCSELLCFSWEHMECALIQLYDGVLGEFNSYIGLIQDMATEVCLSCMATVSDLIICETNNKYSSLMCCNSMYYRTCTRSTVPSVTRNLSGTRELTLKDFNKLGKDCSRCRNYMVTTIVTLYMYITCITKKEPCGI